MQNEATFLSMKIKRNIVFKLFAYGKAKDKFQIRLRVTFNGQRLDLSAGTSPDIVRKWTGHKKEKTMRPYRAAQNIILNNPSSPHQTSPFQVNCGRTTFLSLSQGEVILFTSTKVLYPSHQGSPWRTNQFEGTSQIKS